MKKIITIFFVLIYCLNLTKAWADEEYKEYGIALLLPEKYSNEAQRMNREIAVQVTQEKNIAEIFHITLFQGRFTQTGVAEIYQKLKEHNFTRVPVKFTSEITNSRKRYINWSLKKNDELESLHKAVMETANIYHKGILNRYRDSFNEFRKEDQNQIEAYGMPGLLDNYKPEVTLFYFQTQNQEIEKITEKVFAPKINRKFNKLKIVHLIIGELGYAGNIEKILYDIELQ